MKDSTLETLAPLLAVLRGYSILNETRPATFHLEGRDFIHFHETPGGIFADVLLSKGRVHMPVSTASDQQKLLERIEHKLESLESHDNRKHHREKKAGRTDFRAPMSSGRQAAR